MPTKKDKPFSYRIGLKLNVIKQCGFVLDHQSAILDFGCGSGRYVQELRDHGYQAFGCDIHMKSEDNVDTDSMIRNDIVRSIDFEHYVLPFKDNTFDLIFSDQVFEHVTNYSKTITELSRVLKPGGFCLHIFPSRYIPIEPHVFIPFSTVIKSYWWVHLWVILGVRNEWKDCKSVNQRTFRYWSYLKDKTNYLSKRQLKNEFKSHFKNVIFCEKTFLRNSKRGKYVFALTKCLPFIVSLYSTFRSRVILTRFPIKLVMPALVMNIF